LPAAQLNVIKAAMTSREQLTPDEPRQKVCCKKRQASQSTTKEQKPTKPASKLPNIIPDCFFKTGNRQTARQ
jgi:hypothetical protein